MTQRMKESLEQVRERIVAQASKILHKALVNLAYLKYNRLKDMDDPIAYAAKSNPDTLKYAKDMRAPDAEQFRKGMADETLGHVSKRHWKVITKDKLPRGETILPAIWAFKRKRRIATNKIYKWKARLNLGVHQMVKGRHYDQTYAPVISWSIIR